MADFAEFNPNIQIEELIAHEMLEEGDGTTFLGLAVTVERVSGDVRGIYTTHQSRYTRSLETTLDIHKKPGDDVRGSIFGFDKDNNTLWLRPQRLSSIARNAGYIAVPNFVSDNCSPNFTVKVRRSTWRDKAPFFAMVPGVAWRKYDESGLPRLAYEDVHFIDVQSL